MHLIASDYRTAITILAVSALPVGGCTERNDIGSAAQSARAKGETHSMAKKQPEHAVLVHLKLSGKEFGTNQERESIHALTDKLKEVINAKRLGEFDGDEFGDGGCTLYMYGPDADALFAGIEPLLRSSPVTKEATIIKRYGEAMNPNAKEVKVTF